MVQGTEIPVSSNTGLWDTTVTGDRDPCILHYRIVGYTWYRGQRTLYPPQQDSRILIVQGLEIPVSSITG